MLIISYPSNFEKNIPRINAHQLNFLFSEFSKNAQVLKNLNDNWKTQAPYFLDFEHTIPSFMHSTVANKIRQHYFKNKTINIANIGTLIQLAGDRLFSVDAAKAAMAQARVNKSPVWFFHYRYRANQSLSIVGSNDTSNLGKAFHLIWHLDFVI